MDLWRGAAAAFCLGSGRARPGGGEPTRSREFALMALVTEKIFFLGFDMRFSIWDRKGARGVGIAPGFAIV